MKTRLGIVLAIALVATACGGPAMTKPVSRLDGPLLAAARPPAFDAVLAPGAATPVVVGGATLESTATPTIAQLIGQKLVVRMDGLTPSAALLGRIQRGEVGGVILFGANVSSATQVRALTAKLRAAAAAGGRPRLIIAVDQEGGPIKRIPWAPPTISPMEMGRLGLASVALDQGTRTGIALRGLGINVDFAPLADVPATTSSFLYRQGRTWSFLVGRTTGLADSFATGLEAGRVVPTMKHFPGLGYANQNTDTSVVTITKSASVLAQGLRPFQRAISHQIPMIMLSNATYTAYDPAHAAGWSHAIASTLLRHDLGFTGVTITDSLDGIAHARGVTTRSLAFAAVLAGTDMVLVTGSELTSAGVFDKLVREATAGHIRLTLLRTSYARILALKATL
jgi:beta-N-acetylhexosaminidase